MFVKYLWKFDYNFVVILSIVHDVMNWLLLLIWLIKPTDHMWAHV